MSLQTACKWYGFQMKKFLTLLVTVIFSVAGVAANASENATTGTPENCGQEQVLDALTGSIVSIGNAPCAEDAYATFASDIWSGYMVTASFNKYIGVVGNVTVPARSNFCTKSSWAGWIGLGGRNSHALIQVGITYSKDSNAARLFYEYLGFNSIYPAIYPLSYGFQAGTTVQLKLTYLPNSRAFTISAGYLGDTTPYVQTVALPAGDVFYDGTSAEWVDERMSYLVNGQLVPSNLMDFDVVTWSAAKSLLVGGTYESIAAGNSTSLTMYDYPKILAQPTYGLTNGQTFSDYWKACDGTY